MSILSIAELMNGLSTEVFNNVDLAVIVALMGLGFSIKHFKFLEKINNDFIPPLLLLASFVFTFLGHGITIEAAITAIITAAIAIGLHQSGKNIFTVTIVPKLLELLSGTNNDTTNNGDY